MIRNAVLMIALILVVFGMASIQAQDTGGGEKQKAVRFEKNKDVAEPMLVTKVDPKYPADAKKDKVSGEVRLEVTIGTDGSVVAAKAIKDPDPRLAEAAIDAIKQWKYKPALTKAGKPIQVLATVTVNFKLK
jgi:TonB family protein